MSIDNAGYIEQKLKELNESISNRKGIKKLSGIKFGKLTALVPIKRGARQVKHKDSRWLCKCDCGNFLIVRKRSLVSGNSQSCGCSRLMQMKEKSKPVLSPSLLDIAWAAGFFEGEGSCRYAGNTTRISLPQKGDEMLFKLKDLFGGSIIHHSKRTINTWGLNGVRARGFLMTIYSFLSLRRQKQARVALNVQGCAS